MMYRIFASLGLALVAVTAVADAQQTGQQRPDSIRRDSAGVVRAEAAGDVALTANRGLTRAQVRQLQNALRQAGCNPGAADGVFGARTRQALACARRQRGIESTNANDVLRALNLSFTMTDSVAAGTDVASAERGEPRYGDPTFVRDTGVMRIDADTMPAGLLESSAVFVPSSRSAYSRFLVPVSQDRRSSDVLVPRDTTGVRRETSAPAPQSHLRGRIDNPSPAARADTTMRTRTDSMMRSRTDTSRANRLDTTRLRADTTRTALPDSTLRRMRDELLLTMPPRADSARDTLRRDSTRTRPDTSRRRPPPR